MPGVTRTVRATEKMLITIPPSAVEQVLELYWEPESRHRIRVHVAHSGVRIAQVPAAEPLWRADGMGSESNPEAENS